MPASPGLLHNLRGVPLDCTINIPCSLASIHSSVAHLSLLLVILLMRPKRGVGAYGRGRVRRGRGSRTLRSSRGGRHGATSALSSSSVEEGFWRYDFLLRVLSRNAA